MGPKGDAGAMLTKPLSSGVLKREGLMIPAEAQRSTRERERVFELQARDKLPEAESFTCCTQMSPEEMFPPGRGGDICSCFFGFRSSWRREILEVIEEKKMNQWNKCILSQGSCQAFEGHQEQRCQHGGSKKFTPCVSAPKNGIYWELWLSFQPNMFFSHSLFPYQPHPSIA